MKNNNNLLLAFLFFSNICRADLDIKITQENIQKISQDETTFLASVNEVLTDEKKIINCGTEINITKNNISKLSPEAVMDNKIWFCCAALLAPEVTRS